MNSSINFTVQCNTNKSYLARHDSFGNNLCVILDNFFNILC